MYERFTDRARKVMQLANQEAQRFNHEYIGTEHVLLGLIKEDSGVAAHVLKNLEIDLRKIRLEVEKIVQPGPDMALIGKLPQTPRAKKAIEYAIEEARNLNHNYVGTEHLLLGLIRETEGVAAQVLINLGLELEAVREEVLRLLGASEDRGKPGRKEGPRTKEEVERAKLPKPIRQMIREIQEWVQELTTDKEIAIAQQDFEKAARLRDEADRLLQQGEELFRIWRGKKLLRVQEYELHIPLHFGGTSPVPPDTLANLRERLVNQFGGVVEMRYRIEGVMKLGPATLQGEVILYRVLSDQPAQATLFFTQLKEELKAHPETENAVIMTRRVEVL